MLLSKVKATLKEQLVITNFNEKLVSMENKLYQAVMSHKQYKKHLAAQKKSHQLLAAAQRPKVFMLNFHGDIQASAVTSLCGAISAILTIATTQDEVVVKIDSGGGMVPNYGLAAAQLQRIRAQQIPLTVTIDKIAASGGYLMACVANKIIAAPFAIIGSIGVIVQMPNFNRWLQEQKIDFEQVAAGNYKRTLTLFGHNTQEGRDKLCSELNDIHHQFQELIKEFRPNINLPQVATGEFWLAKNALALNLVDALSTSDEYLIARSKNSDVYEINYAIKTKLTDKLKSFSYNLLHKFFTPTTPWS